ncbi:hypothetical protein [Cognaticolwellia mytili]|uniref:hypothetical protein n=1 Tax=Cognaticolwellia mytili TaxID=1888913 RepID=UPI001B80CDD6|nr:hypothetical protein [Cognaticolwellia mytili]
MNNFWRIVGVGLFLWAAWDIYFGYTFLYDVIYKEQDPTLYWITLSVWTFLGLSCFYTKEE